MSITEPNSASGTTGSDPAKPGPSPGSFREAEFVHNQWRPSPPAAARRNLAERVGLVLGGLALARPAHLSVARPLRRARVSAGRGVGLAEVLVASSIALVVAVLVCAFFWTGLQRARWTAQASSHQRKVLFELDRIVRDLSLSAPEGVRWKANVLTIVPQVRASVAERRWRRAAILYGVDAGALWQMEQVYTGSDYASEPSFPALPPPAMPGWQRRVTPGFSALQVVVRGDAVVVEATVELLRSDGASTPVHLTRTAVFAL